MKLLITFLCWAAVGGSLGPVERMDDGRPTVSVPQPVVIQSIPAPIRADPYWLACPALVTAYSPHDPLDAEYALTKGADRWKTATMVDVRSTPYGLAVDPRALPYDAQVVIPGYRSIGAPNAVYRPDDTGGRLRQTWTTKRLLHVDVRFTTTYSARQWGVRYQLIWVLVQPQSKLEQQLLAHNLRQHWLAHSLGLLDRPAPPG